MTLFINQFKKTNRLKNKEIGKRCFILCNGPSINNHNLNLIKNEVIIGMNASTLLEGEYDFISNYYVVSDLRFISHPEKSKFASTMLNPFTKCVFRKEIEDQPENTSPNDKYYIDAISRDGFSKNLVAGYFFGCTTTMLAIQLAYFIGIKDVYLLGCDLKYSKKSPRFYHEEAVQIEDSFTSVQISNLLNASKIFETEDRHIYHCNEKSFLNPYIDYKDFNSLF